MSTRDRDEQPKTFGCHHNAETCRLCEDMVKRWKEKREKAHQLEKHEDCQEPGTCMVCDGGLAVCTICKAYEGGLATECPGVVQTGDETDAVYAGRLDFLDGEWVAK